ncbi:MAG: TonB-dependent receptor, partial [Acidobacteriota bacterium]
DFVDQKLGFTVKGSYNPSESFSLVSGLDYYRIKADFTSFIANQPVINVDTVAPFVNTEYRVGPLSLHAGARYDYDSSFGSQLSPSVGANLNFLKATLVRVNVARTFKVPDLWYTLGESYFDRILPNPDLKPERAWAYSAGFESQALRYVWVKASGYYHRMTDGIIRVPADLEGRFTWGNATKFIRKGYEAEIGFMTPFGLTGYFGTNYNRHENTTEPEGVVLTWIPTRTYKTGLKYKNEPFDLLVSLRGRWIWWNESEDLIALFFPKDKRWSFDLRVSKGFNITANTRFSVFFDAFNIFNQLYWDRSDFPNPRRWAQFGLEFAFR